MGLGPPVMGGGLAAVFVFWVHPCWGPLAGCSLFSPLFECSACHSLDCLVSFIGAGSTRDGRRACCCFCVLLGSPVLGSVGWLLVVFAPFRVFCLPLVRYLLRIVSWGWVHPCWAAGLLLFVAVYRVRGLPKFLHGISSLFLPPPSLPCQVPSPYNGTAYVLWPRCSFTPYSSSHNAYIKV